MHLALQLSTKTKNVQIEHNRIKKTQLIYIIFKQQQQVLQKCTGPQMAGANLGGTVNLSVGNA